MKSSRPFDSLTHNTIIVTMDVNLRSHNQSESPHMNILSYRDCRCCHPALCLQAVFQEVYVEASDRPSLDCAPGHW